MYNRIGTATVFVGCLLIVSLLSLSPGICCEARAGTPDSRWMHKLAIDHFRETTLEASDKISARQSAEVDAKFWLEVMYRYSANRTPNYAFTSSDHGISIGIEQEWDLEEPYIRRDGWSINR